MKKFAIIGGGIGGLTLAIAMQRKGMDVQVFESAPHFLPLGAGIVLAANAMKALAEIGIDKEIIPAGKGIKRMLGKDSKGRVISFTDAEQLTRELGIQNNFTIHRADLHNVLLKLITQGTIALNKTCVDFEQNASGVNIHFSDGSSVHADFLIACDGVHSPIRKKLLPESQPRYAGYTCWRAVVDDVPNGFSESETSESWGPGRRFGVVPLKNHCVYWFATLNAPENDPISRAFTLKDLYERFRNFHFPIPEILERTKDVQLIWSDIIDIKPIKQFAFGKIVLLGDAAHATTPNMGQGACMAIEDAAVLANGLMKYPAEEAFMRFGRHRIGRTSKIVNQSWNFGRIAQLENPLLIYLRNAAMRRVSQKTIDKQLKLLYNISFDS